MVLLRHGEELQLEVKDDLPLPRPIFHEREVCAIFDQGVLPRNPALVVRMYGKRTTNVPLASEVALPFLFPLLFPFGESIWHVGSKHTGPNATAIRNQSVVCFLPVFQLNFISILQHHLR
jgi:hypothetical protein